MKFLMRIKNPGAVLIISLVAAAGCAAPVGTPLGAATQGRFDAAPTLATRTQTVDKDDGASRQTAGMRIHVEPQTGEVTAPPSDSPGAYSQNPALQAVKPAVTELYETLSPRPGGGFMVELKEHFQSPLTAMQDTDGKVSVQH